MCCRVSDGEGVVAVHARIGIGKRRVLLVGGEIVGAGPGECGACGRGLRGQLQHIAGTGGVCGGRSVHSVAGGVHSGGGVVCTTVVVLDGDGVCPAVQVVERRIRLEIEAVDRVGEPVAHGTADGDDTVRLVAAGVVRDGESRDIGHRQHIHMDGGGVVAAVAVGDRDSVVAALRGGDALVGGVVAPRVGVSPGGGERGASALAELGRSGDLDFGQCVDGDGESLGLSVAVAEMRGNGDVGRGGLAAAVGGGEGLDVAGAGGRQSYVGVVPG